MGGRWLAAGELLVRNVAAPRHPASLPPWHPGILAHSQTQLSRRHSSIAALRAQRLPPTWLLVGNAGAAGGGIAGSFGSEATILLTMAWIFSRSEFS